MNELKRYAYYSFMVELLCLVNIIAQFFFMDRFLGGEFLSYGPRGNCSLYYFIFDQLFIYLQCPFLRFSFADFRCDVKKLSYRHNLYLQIGLDKRVLCDVYFESKLCKSLHLLSSLVFIHRIVGHLFGCNHLQVQKYLKLRCFLLYFIKQIKSNFFKRIFLLKNRNFRLYRFRQLYPSVPNSVR